jgi:hypothetical protein
MHRNIILKLTNMIFGGQGKIMSNNEERRTEQRMKGDANDLENSETEIMNL